jgi:hypothetical protein
MRFVEKAIHRGPGKTNAGRCSPENEIDPEQPRKCYTTLTHLAELAGGPVRACQGFNAIEGSGGPWVIGDVSTVDGGRRGRKQIKGYCWWLLRDLRRDCCYGAGGLGCAWAKCCPQNLTNQSPKATASSGWKAIGMRFDEQFKAISRPTSIASVRLSSMGPISDCSPETTNTRWIACPLALTRTLMSLLIRRSTGASTAVQL